MTSESFPAFGPLLIPVLALSIPIVAIIAHYLGKAYSEWQRHQTIREFVRAGQPVPPELLAADFGSVVVVEPHLAKCPIEGVPLETAEEALRTADIVVILVAHRAFGRLRRELFHRPSVVDTVGLLTR